MKKLSITLIVVSLLVAAGCQRNVFEKQTIAPSSLRDVPSIRLNYRFESDVPAPPPQNQPQSEEKNNAIQADFDQARHEEVLEKTITSPDKKRVLAVYRVFTDLETEYRLDMYTAEGKLLRKITPQGMAVHFPDTIVWSPDSTNVAFVAMVRSLAGAPAVTPPDTGIGDDAPANTAPANTNTENANAETNSNSNTQSVQSNPAADQPQNVLTFRTEQVYSCNSDGGELKPLTQQEGIIYFYFVWAPDSSALAALATTWREWQFAENMARSKGEVFIPAGRPRLIEKNGRERRLDDNPTAVHPAWSPDSAKVALAYDKEVRIYDAIGDAPTGAAIPLRNPLLLASKSFDEELKKKEAGAANQNTNSNAGTNSQPAPSANANQAQQINTLPDENTLVSFNPIVDLAWPEDKMLYLQTGYVKEMRDAANSARSYMRWHRMMFSPQAVKLN